MVIAKDTPLTAQIEAIYQAIASFSPNFVKRTQIAEKLGKKSLNSGDLVILQLLAEQGRIEAVKETTRAPSGERYVYRIPGGE